MIVYERTYFGDLGGKALDSGKLYIGEADKDPEIYPVACFWDADLSVPAAQPLAISSGYVIDGGARAAIYTAASEYSLRVRNKNDVQIDYVPKTGSPGPVLTFEMLGTSKVEGDLIQTGGATRGVLIADDTLNDTDMAAHPLAIAKTANGRFFRRDERTLSVRQFGAGGGFPKDDYSSVVAALAYARRFALVNSIYYGVPEVRWEPGRYYVSGTITLKQTQRIVGPGVGREGGTAVLIETAGQPLFAIERADTLNGELVPGESGGGDGVHIEGLAWKPRVNVTKWGQDNAPGMVAHARFTMRDCYIRGYEGAACLIRASNAVVGFNRGNANLYWIERCTFEECFNGLDAMGTDANQGITIGLNVVNCKAIGIADRSALGSMHYGAHAAGCGQGVPGFPVMCSYEGKRYAPALGADALWSTTVPGTNKNVWKYFEDGGPLGGSSSTAGIPLWTGQAFIFGAAYVTFDRNARAKFDGCYVEGTCAPAQVQWPSWVCGGLVVQVGDGQYLNAEQRAMQAEYFRSGGAYLDGGNSALAIEGDNLPTYRLKPHPGGFVRGDFGNNDGFVSHYIHGPGTSDPRGPNTYDIKGRLGLPGGGALNGWASSIPTSNLPYRAVFLNIARSAVTQPMGWSNIPGSTTWLPFGAQAT